MALWKWIVQNFANDCICTSEENSGFKKEKEKFQDLKQITENTISRTETEESEGGPDFKGNEFVLSLRFNLIP